MKEPTPRALVAALRATGCATRFTKRLAAGAAGPAVAVAAAAGMTLLAVAQAALAQATPPGAADAAPVRAEFDGRWVRPADTLVLRVPQRLAGADLRFVAAGTDVTALARAAGPGEFHVELRAAPLVPGESEFVVWRVDGSAWEEVARFALKVLTSAGFEKSRFDPKLDLANKSTVDSNARGSAVPPPRPTYADLTGRGGVGFEFARDRFGVEGSFNAAGSSYRNEALRYGELQSRAPKADLADYVVNTRWRDTTLTVGHLSWGTHPLLLSGYGSRGLMLGQKIGSRVDVSLAAMNGTGIVGYDNFLGLDSEQHRIYGAGLGVELVGGRPGALRAELALMDASLESRGNFNVGEVTDAETSRGLGLRLSGSTAGNRVRGDAAFARSRYVNPFDPQLAQGGTSQAVARTTHDARSANLAVDVVQGAQWFSPAQPFTTTLTLHHGRFAPLYRSIGASVSSDQQLDRAGLALRLGATQLQFNASRLEDNLDDVPTVLKNRTDTGGVTLTLPPAPWRGADPGRTWWPQLTLGTQRVHQFALNTPVIADSGIAASHRPDQVNRSHQLGLAWSREPLTLSYGASYATQDNRQPGRELADFANLGHQVTLGLRVLETLNVSIGLNRARNYSVEKDLASYTNGGTLGFDWTWAERWSLAANAGRTLADDSRDLSRTVDRTAQAQLSYRFSVPGPGRRLPGQVFVRYARQGNDVRDNVFGLSSQGVNTAWDAGLSLSLF
jgi:hypothetical protein